MIGLACFHCRYTYGLQYEGCSYDIDISTRRRVSRSILKIYTCVIHVNKSGSPRHQSPSGGLSSSNKCNTTKQSSRTNIKQTLQKNKTLQNMGIICRECRICHYQLEYLSTKIQMKFGQQTARPQRKEQRWRGNKLADGRSSTGTESSLQPCGSLPIFSLFTFRSMHH
jgi:hypothetical protein